MNWGKAVGTVALPIVVESEARRRQRPPQRLKHPIDRLTRDGLIAAVYLFFDKLP
jgi:hypothetical protein